MMVQSGAGRRALTLPTASMAARLVGVSSPESAEMCMSDR